MKEFWLQKNECTGCGACENICPVDALKLNSDDCGFKYPDIANNCINCNLCEKVCFAKTKCFLNNTKTPKVYAAWAKDDNIRYTSTSGGAFSVFAQEILSQEGVVVGASYNGNNLVEHTMISNFEDTIKLRQSKYVQSNIGLIFRKIKNELECGKTVVFCGTPCQVAGLYAFLGDSYSNNLITFDFICRGVNSPKAYEAWIKDLENIQKNKVSKVWFKYKINGWTASPLCTRVDFSDNKFKVFTKKDNLFMLGYLRTNLYMRPSCGECLFKKMPRVSNITLADFWGIDKELNDDKGVSMVLINNDYGKSFFDKIKDDLIYFERQFDEIVAGNKSLFSSATINKNSEKFLKQLNHQSFSKVYKKFEMRFKINNFIKKILKKITIKY